MLNGSRLDCRPRRGLTSAPRLDAPALGFVVPLLWVCLAVSDLGAEPPKEQGTDNGAAKLSLETLFHPKKKVDFDGSLPRTHWIQDSTATLLIRRDDQWNEVSLPSGSERPWPIVEKLEQNLLRLDGVTKEQAHRVAINAVTKLSSSNEMILVRIGKSLATASAEGSAKWLTRDATAWNNVTLDPTGRLVGYTRNGDFFLVDLATQRTLQLTHDAKDTLLDGVLDWTYQEEIFGRGNFRGFWFSPDGNWLAMLRIDTHLIEPYVLSSASSDRGHGITSRYPKAGDPIPHAELYLWDLRQVAGGDVPDPTMFAQSTPQNERIITGVWWHPDNPGLYFTISDRPQSWRELRRVSMTEPSGVGPHSQLLLREESPTWIEPPKPPGWLADGSLLWYSHLPTGRARLFRIEPHGHSITPVTPRGFDVHEFFVADESAADEPARAIVTGDAVAGIGQRRIYQINLDSPRDQAPTELATWEPMTKQAGWHSVQVSDDRRWLVDRFSTATRPGQLVARSTESDESVVLAESQLTLRSGLNEPRLFQIDTPDGIQLPALLVRPADASPNQPCPVVIEVYGGPQAPVVSNRWAGTKSLYRELLARRGIATLVVDNRSSAGRGMADSWSIHLRVGEVEFQDLQTAVGWLKSQAWVDASRLAIRGWSFGGFLTLYAMTHSDEFAAGIAGGSVTDWREYDAFYTERYMGLPQDNSAGYDATAPVAFAKDLQGRVLLIHGEADDNVHPSSTLRMAAALQEAGKDFQLMIYPGAAHGIRDPNQLWHLSQMTHRFLLQQLGR